MLVAVNLTGAVLPDASGLAVLVDVHRRAARAGKVFLVIGPDPRTRQVLRLTGLDHRLVVFATIGDFVPWGGDPSGLLSSPHTRTTNLSR